MVGHIRGYQRQSRASITAITGEQALILDNVVSDIDNPFPTAQVLFLGGTQKK